jgi:hypothetical protein
MLTSNFFKFLHSEGELFEAGLGLLNAYADLTGDKKFSRDLMSARRIEQLVKAPYRRVKVSLRGLLKEQ